MTCLTWLLWRPCEWFLPLFWWNSPGTLPGLGPMSSPNISFLPTPSPTGTHPDLGPYSSLGYFLPYVKGTETQKWNSMNISIKGIQKYIMKRCSNIMKIELSDMNDSCPFFGEIVLGPSLARAQWPPLIFPSSQPHSDRDPPWPGPIFLLMVCPSLYYLVAAYIDTLTKER